MNMEIAGHEFFDVDGKTIWYDLQTPRGEVFWLASAAPDGNTPLVPRRSRPLVGALPDLARRQVVRRRRRRRGNGGAREGRQVAVPVHAAGNSRCRGNLGAERRRPGASRNAARRAAGRHEEARLPAGAQHHLHARRQVAHLPLEHARRRAHLHGGAGERSPEATFLRAMAPVRLVFEQSRQPQWHHGLSTRPPPAKAGRARCAATRVPPPSG